MPLHPAWLKNISRRVLWAAFEKDITADDRAAMAKHFEGRCAYCGDELGQRWHADHLVSVYQGGFNHISNRVACCPGCNEREKQEKHWLDFLSAKCDSDLQILERRKNKIASWQERHNATRPPITETQRQAWKTEVDNLADAIDSAWNRLKRLKHVD